MKKKRLLELKSKVMVRINLIRKKTLDDLAKKTSFIKRSSSRLTGSDFFQLMTMEHFDDAAISLEGLSDVLSRLNPKAVLSPQALHQRIISNGAIEFMKEVFSMLHKEFLTPVVDKFSTSVLESFERVFLEDSTQMELNERLAKEFKGSGGMASKSSMKIDLLYELKRHTIEKLLISSGTVPDQKRAGSIMDIIRPKDLFIRDLGYFAIGVFKKVHEKGAYFLSRYKTKTNVYENKEDSDPIPLLSLIQKHIRNGVMDVDIFFRGRKTFLSYSCLSSLSRSC